MSNDRASGLALIIGGLASVGVVASHPTGNDVIAAAAHNSYGVTTSVHGVAIAAEVLLAFGVVALAARLGEARNLSIGGLVAYAFGTVAVIIAAVASGWLAPAALAGGVNAQGEVTDIARALFRQSGHINQAFASIGFSLVAAAIALWSLAMLRLRMWRWLGILGVVLGSVVLVGIGSGSGLPLHGFGGVAMLLQLGWLLGVGGVLVGGRAEG
ncbi:MAG: hypothetical protein ABIZ91_18380 [Gemmatimonadaceae bacterium]